MTARQANPAQVGMHAVSAAHSGLMPVVVTVTVTVAVNSCCTKSGARRWSFSRFVVRHRPCVG